MNGRLERLDGRLELVSEANYQHIVWELREARIQKWKKRIRRTCYLIGWSAFFAALWRYR